MKRPDFQRILEMIPGGLVWLTLFFAIALSFLNPVAAIVLVILFDLYWLFRVGYFVIYVVIAWRRFRQDSARDWFADMSRLPGAADLVHLIFIPTYKEDIEILRATFSSLVASKFPDKDKRFIVVLAGEERDSERFRRNAEALSAEFGAAFKKILVFEHPRNLPDEIPGKGSNLNFAGHRAQEYVDSLGIPYERVIVSAFDVDTCVHPQYFAHLTFAYATHPDPTRTSFQPVALYNNNMWESPAVVRVAAFGTTFWLLTELARPERLCTFSSHSMSFRALADVGFWQKDIVTEDSRIFLQCLLRYDGDYAVTPMFVPVSMDTVVGENLWQSMANLYKQQRRWAWGVEHFPYLAIRFAKNPRFPLAKKIYYLWTLTEGMWTWATAPLLIFILGRLPLAVAPEAVREITLFQNTPNILDALMTFSMVGVFATAIVSLTLLPPRPAQNKSRASGLVMVLQWLLVPVTFIAFGSIPAIDAQTRLMLGKYLGFNVTAKKRKETALTAESAAA